MVVSHAIRLAEYMVKADLAVVAEAARLEVRYRLNLRRTILTPFVSNV